MRDPVHLWTAMPVVGRAADVQCFARRLDALEVGGLLDELHDSFVLPSEDNASSGSGSSSPKSSDTFFWSAHSRSARSARRSALRRLRSRSSICLSRGSSGVATGPRLRAFFPNWPASRCLRQLARCEE